MRIHGGCHCGAIAYEAEVDPATMSICHCTDCQRLSGSAFRTSIPSLPGTFTLVRGQPKVYVKTAQSGSRRAQGFCGDCGSPIYSAPVDDPAAARMVRTGTIEERAALRPGRQIWCRSAQPWIGDLEGVPGSPAQELF